MFLLRVFFVYQSAFLLRLLRDGSEREPKDNADSTCALAQSLP